jgi:septin 3/9/12
MVRLKILKPPPPVVLTQYINSLVLEENNVRLKLSITDTPGFGEQLDNTDCWIPAVEYVNQQMELYLSEELSADRPSTIPDHRVHACLYFIAPTGHGYEVFNYSVLIAPLLGGDKDFFILY